MSEWQPIETAPRDRLLVLWWRPTSSRLGNPVIGSICGDGPYDGMWWSGQFGFYQDVWHITHWMPLPTPPKEAK